MVAWILITVLVLLIVLGIIAIIISKNAGKGKKRPSDYYNFFIMGIIWLPFGILMSFVDGDSSIGNIFIILGLVYTVIGLAHKKDWKKNRQPPLIKSKFWRWGIVVLGILVFLGLSAFYFMRN